MIFSFISKQNMGLQDYITEYYSFSLFGYLKQVKANITRNDEKITFNDCISTGDLIKIVYKPIKQDGIISHNDLLIVYEDDNFIVVDKPFHLPSIPSKRHPDDSIYNRLLGYFEGSENTIHILTRLDKETAGLMLIAKNQVAASFSKKIKIDKFYLAESINSLPQLVGTIDLPIGNVEGYKRGIDDNGLKSVTEYRLISVENGIYTYEVHLLTGRTHQIRVHFSSQGSSIINDELYGEKIDDGPMHLLMKKLIYLDPFSKEKKEFTSSYEFK